MFRINYLLICRLTACVADACRMDLGEAVQPENCLGRAHAAERITLMIFRDALIAAVFFTYTPALGTIFFCMGFCP